MSIISEGVAVKTEAGAKKFIARADKNHGDWIPKAAEELRVDPSVIKGILAMESGARPFKMGESIQQLFMVELFIKKYKAKFGKDGPHPWMKLENKHLRGGKGDSQGRYGHRSQWRQAAALWEKGAYEYTSWGLFQIHPWHGVPGKLGYSSAKALVNAFKGSREAQVKGFIRWTKMRDGGRLLQAMRKKDWWYIALRYNGAQNGAYARGMQKIYNVEHPSQQDNSKVAGSKKAWSGGKGGTAAFQAAAAQKYGERGAATPVTDVAVADTRPRAAGQRIVLIGDSNASHLNKEYNTHYIEAGAKVLPLKRDGSGAKYWLDVMKMVKSGKATLSELSGRKSNASQIIGFKPTQVHMTSMGGNDSGYALNKDKLAAYIDGTIKPLMQLMSKYPGSTFSGTPVVGAESMKGGTSSNVLRARLNAAMAKAAKGVGIPFWDPHASVAYDNTALDRRCAKKKAKGEKCDDYHITRAMAGKEFTSRAGFLGGRPGGGGGQVAVADANANAAEGEDMAYWDPRANDGKGGMVYPGDEGRRQQELTAAEVAARKKMAAGLQGALGALMQKNCRVVTRPSGEQKRICKTVSDLSKDDVKSAMAAAKKSQEAPPAEEMVTIGAEEEVALGPGKKGHVLKKYLPILRKHQPDFDFDKFYSEVDNLAANVIDKVLPSHGRDYVFGDEHWNAFVLMRDLKDKEHAKVVAESLNYLRGLIFEVRQKW